MISNVISDIPFIFYTDFSKPGPGAINLNPVMKTKCVFWVLIWLYQFIKNPT